MPLLPISAEDQDLTDIWQKPYLLLHKCQTLTRPAVRRHQTFLIRELITIKKRAKCSSFHLTAALCCDDCRPAAPVWGLQGEPWARCGVSQAGSVHRSAAHGITRSGPQLSLDHQTLVISWRVLSSAELQSGIQVKTAVIVNNGSI